MSYRDSKFREKFESAARHLGGNFYHVVSLKFRENVYYDDYITFFDSLGTANSSIQRLPLEGSFAGNAHLIPGPGQQAQSDDRKIIAVEHETGLEILYLSSAVASLLGFILSVAQVWSSVRSKSRQWGGPYRSYTIEVRYYGRSGQLIEERHAEISSSRRDLHLAEGMLERIVMYEPSPSSLQARDSEIARLQGRVKDLEEQLSQVIEASHASVPRSILEQREYEITQLRSRVQALEEQLEQARASQGFAKSIASLFSRPFGAFNRRP